MNLDTMLRTATPRDLPPLDHERLQRAGSLRRTATRLVTGTAVLSLLAAGGLAVGNLLPPQPNTPYVSDVAPLEQPMAPSTEENTTQTTDDPDTEPGQETRAEADDAVLTTYAVLTHAEALSALAATLAQTPRRPADLTSITTYQAEGGDRVERLRGDETAQDFPVRTVLDPEFDPAAGFETPALQPTWDQRSAELALDALAQGWTFIGVDVDAIGRTVIVFQSETSQQFVQVDPASGYTSGIAFAAGEWEEATESEGTEGDEDRTVDEPPDPPS
jgi:hypothetical protein